MFSSVASFVADIGAKLIGAISLQPHTGRSGPSDHTILPTGNVVCKNCRKGRVELIYPFH